MVQLSTNTVSNDNLFKSSADNTDDSLFDLTQQAVEENNNAVKEEAE
jgi:hypothetical protein